MIDYKELVADLRDADQSNWKRRSIDAAAAIEELEAEVKRLEPKRGEWKCSYPEIEPNPMFMYGICSICGFEQSISNKLNYCPHCGAKMGGTDESLGSL